MRAANRRDDGTDGARVRRDGSARPNDPEISGEVPDASSAPDGSTAPDAPEIAASDGAGASDLSERDRAMLAFERQWWKYAGAKEQAVRAKFGLSATRYYQLLNQLIDRPEALAHDPMTVKRLRRLRTRRQRQRAARRLGHRS
jgi:Protein of unknown function (DUF3263)